MTMGLWRKYPRVPSESDFKNVVASSGSMIVISNRLPFVLQRGPDGKLVRKASAGGLVTAVAPVVINGNGFWVGWPGIHLEDPNEPIPESDPDDVTPTAGLKSEKVIPVQIDPLIFDSYYNGCCNATFWPLFHSMPDRANFKREHWKNYVTANKEFAECTMRALRQIPKNNGDMPLVWVHDYHLMLASNWIRQFAEEEGINIKLGFFLHIPFPSWDIFRLFPWSDEILQGMLACDMVGFHITDYCLNFVDCCQRNLGCRVDRKNLLVEHGGRTVRVRPLPIGIPFERFVELAEKATNKYPPNQKKIILGVDRLDYTKGLVHRLLAFEKLLEKHPEHLEEVTLFQISVPSRTDVKEYQDLKEEIDQLVGRINGRFTTYTWSPIRYIYGCVSQDELVSFYRYASVGLVTPLRDGMNLVAKEFVACQINIPPGVLIVSPFAGAGETMHEALICNPYEIDDASDAIHRALTMPEDERILRMNYLRRREKLNDVNYWTKSFLSAMGSLQTQDDHDDVGTLSMPAVTLDDFDEYLAKYIGNTHKLALLLDYDGTLAPIAPHPDLAIIPAETKKVLERLSNLSDVYIAIVSGRNVNNVKEMVGIEGITYAGNHGLEILHPDGTKFVHPMPTEFHAKVGELMRQLQETVCKHGAWVENKGALLTFHFRETPHLLRAELEAQATKMIEDAGFIVGKAHCAIEAKPPVQWNKGRASIYILRTAFGVDWSERIRIIYVGDDATDEDAMMALKGMAATFRVTSSHIIKTSAERRLPSTDAVLTMLKWVERHLSRRKPSVDPSQYRRNSLAKAATTGIQIEMSMQVPSGSTNPPSPTNLSTHSVSPPNKATTNSNLSTQSLSPSDKATNNSH